MMKEWEQDFYGANVAITTRDQDCAIYRIGDATGDTVLTRFEVYPGIALVYNDVHTDYIAIGEMEGYENILAVNMKAGVKKFSFFPQAHYHGVTIELDFDEIEANHNIMLEELQLSPKMLKDKFCVHNRCFVLHEKPEFEHLFAELYLVPEQIKKNYYKIKVMEILLFLSAVEPTNEKLENRYFNKDLVAKVKEIHEYMIKHLDEKITIDYLAETFGVSATNLKKGFKEIYGQSVYAYLKEKRVHKASEYLRENDYEIGKIAGLVGYDNASKFSSSFKSIMGINPSEYKKSV